MIAVMNYYERHKRSLAKMVGFHSLVIAADLGVIQAITHHTAITLSILLFSNLASGFIYFFHERLWNRIRWGRQIPGS
jgi:uncharacterized membrane protein